MSYISRTVVEDALYLFLSQPAIVFTTTKSRLEWTNFFLTNPTEDSYQNMLYAFAGAVVPTGFRLLIAESDGTVVYDSSRSAVANQFANINKIAVNSVTNTAGYVINENHNSRPEIMQAILSESGNATSLRYSKSVSNELQYYALRLGNSPSVNVGTIRASLPSN